MSSPAEPVDPQAVPLDAALLRAWPMPVRQGGDKFARGTAAVVGGSPRTPGAVRLAGEAALRGDRVRFLSAAKEFEQRYLDLANGVLARPNEIRAIISTSAIASSR